MSGFKDMVNAHNHSIFLDLSKFAEPRTVVYDGETYTDIPLVLSGLKEKDRRALTHDHARGLYQVTSVMHCAISDMGGKKPEKGRRIKINGEEGGGGFFYEFYIASSVCEKPDSMLAHAQARRSISWAAGLRGAIIPRVTPLILMLRICLFPYRGCSIGLETPLSRHFGASLTSL